MKGVEPTFNITDAVKGREEEVGITVDSVELIVFVTSTVVALAVDAFTVVALTVVASTVVALAVVASAVVALDVVALAVVCSIAVAFAVVTSIIVVASAVVPSAVNGNPFVGVVICSVVIKVVATKTTVEVESDEVTVVVGAAIDNMEDVDVTSAVEDDNVVVEAEVLTFLSHSCTCAPSSASWKQYSTKFFK